MTGERRHAVMAVISMVVLIAIGAAVWSANRPSAKDDAAAPQASPAPGDATPGPSVIVPGRPGEEASVRPAEEIRRPGLPAYNAMDVEYVRMMIPHHTQALRMSALAPERAADAKVRAMAERIHASQAPELGVLRAWLTERGLAEAAGDHDHGTMPGMQSDTAMQRLADARGAEFDRLFVEMMVEHHEGAIEMSTNLLKVGRDLTMEELATGIAAEQAVEINRLRALLPQ